MTAALPIQPLVRRPDVEITVPGSKSFTNRALVCAALADGTSTLTGALFADDTHAMTTALHRLGVAIEADASTETMHIHGRGGNLAPGPVELDVRLAATAARFLAPVLALGRGAYRLDGKEALRRRPIGPLVTALRDLGVGVSDAGAPGHLPIVVEADGLPGGRVRLPGDVSSQFVSGLLLAAPYAARPLEIEVTTDLVSRPYIDVTDATMRSFGVEIDRSGEPTFRVRPARYASTTFAVEPDASAASYFFAAAAITGGRVRVVGLGRRAVQGDMAFVSRLEEMGAEVRQGDDWTEVRGPSTLHGIDADLSDISDTVPTLAVVGTFADSSSRLGGIGFIRGKETDRIHAVVTELRRCGIAADEEPDAIVVHPGAARPARVETYDDHRMAMAFALLGLGTEGIEITDPDCVAKTYPGYFRALEQLR